MNKQSPYIDTSIPLQDRFQTQKYPSCCENGAVSNQLTCNQHLTNPNRAPLNHHQYSQQHHHSLKPNEQTWSEYIAVQKKQVEWVPEQRVEYVPVEREHTDYVEVKHQIDYMPVKQFDKKIEYIPVERLEERTEYIPQHSTYVNGELQDGSSKYSHSHHAHHSHGHGHTNGHTNGHTHQTGHTNGHTHGHTHQTGHTNGHTHGHHSPTKINQHTHVPPMYNHQPVCQGKPQDYKQHVDSQLQGGMSRSQYIAGQFSSNNNNNNINNNNYQSHQNMNTAYNNQQHTSNFKTGNTTNKYNHPFNKPY